MLRGSTHFYLCVFAILEATGCVRGASRAAAASPGVTNDSVIVTSVPQRGQTQSFASSTVLQHSAQSQSMPAASEREYATVSPVLDCERRCCVRVCLHG